MRVIVCGAGHVGMGIIRYLAAEKNDIVVIDESVELIKKVEDSMDVQTVVGVPCHPESLHRAGATEAEMLVAVTPVDEVNMVACQVAHSLFHLPLKIAHLRNQAYLDPRWFDLFSTNHMPIDVVISPEVEIAKAIQRNIRLPGAFDLIPSTEGEIRVIGVKCSEECPILYTPLRQLTTLFPDLNVTVIGIIRNDELMIPTQEDQMLPGDEVYFITVASQVDRVMLAFGYEEIASRHILILGAGNIGVSLARGIEAAHPEVSVKIIEHNKERAKYISQNLSQGVVLQGDALDVNILKEAGVQKTETVVAVTNDTEVNVLASLLAKQNGAKRSITLVNNPAYTSLVTSLGIDAVINPRMITISSILQHVRRGRIRSVHSLRDGLGEVIEADVPELSRIVGSTVGNINIPNSIFVGAIVREGLVVVPQEKTTIHAGDRLVILSTQKGIGDVEKLFMTEDYF
ncbi:MAG: Trk system potassium transporter TrkA [Alphaproteobacteria bacterium]|jgi:trk system potassium uptake protein|nr:Trk system potassium transporter TrkA [Alphaproteobacteria bacterium]MBT5390455.1 Trk system potassium transporter TrkA [Alphaproteobacteria bacterium]MBT5655181.1 Trk system potassium transporter TrkA [Alphaproteobacteria bacterium]